MYNRTCYIWEELIASEFNLFLNHCKSKIICKDEQLKLEMLTWFHLYILQSHSGLHCLVPPLEVQKPSTKFGNLKSSNSRLWAVDWNCCTDMMLFASYEVLFPYTRYCTSYIHLPAFFYPLLANFDNVQRCLLESFCNTHLSDQSWLQASLPINSGGLGIRSATMLAPSAFLASAAGTSSISLALLPPRLTSE